jgi:AcrR family transcriptional regulator
MTRVAAYYAESRTAEILDAAWRCFARRGYHQTTMQDIAAEVDLTPGALYRYYPGKEAILKAISDRSLTEDSTQMAGARTAAGEPIGSLEFLREAMVAFFAGDEFECAARVAIELRPEFLRNQDLLPGVRENLRMVREELVALMTEARRRGQLVPDADPEALAVLAMCVNEAMKFFRLVDPDGFDLRRCLDLLRTLLTSVEDGRRGVA